MCYQSDTRFVISEVVFCRKSVGVKSAFLSLSQTQKRADSHTHTHTHTRRARAGLNPAMHRVPKVQGRASSCLRPVQSPHQGMHPGLEHLSCSAHTHTHTLEYASTKNQEKQEKNGKSRSSTLHPLGQGVHTHGPPVRRSGGRG